MKDGQAYNSYRDLCRSFVGGVGGGGGGGGGEIFFLRKAHTLKMIQ